MQPLNINRREGRHWFWLIHARRIIRKAKDKDKMAKWTAAHMQSTACTQAKIMWKVER